MISLSYGSSKSCKKPWRWMKPGLIFTMRGIYTNPNLDLLLKGSSNNSNSSRSMKTEDTIPWKICEIFAKIKGCAMKKEHSILSWKETVIGIQWYSIGTVIGIGKQVIHRMRYSQLETWIRILNVLVVIRMQKEVPSSHKLQDHGSE